LSNRAVENWRHRAETYFYKGIYKVEIIKSGKLGSQVKALEDIPVTSTSTIHEGEQFLTLNTYLKKQKKTP
jgi:hypothetical protein